MINYLASVSNHVKTQYCVAQKTIYILKKRIGQANFVKMKILHTDIQEISRFLLYHELKPLRVSVSV